MLFAGDATVTDSVTRPPCTVVSDDTVAVTVGGLPGTTCSVIVAVLDRGWYGTSPPGSPLEAVTERMYVPGHSVSGARYTTPVAGSTSGAPFTSTQLVADVDVVTPPLVVVVTVAHVQL